MFYLLGVLGFCLGGCAVHFWLRPEPATAEWDGRRVSRVLNLLLAVLCIGFPFYWRYISGLLSDAAASDLWISLRAQLLAEHLETVSGFSAMDNLTVVADLTVLIAWYHRDTEKVRAWAAFVVFAVYNVLTAGRSGFVSVLVSLFTIELMRVRRIRWRSTLILGTVLVVAFCGLGILLRKAGADQADTLAENAPALVKGVQLYAIGGVVAFDKMYEHPGLIPATQNIDRNFRIAASKLGIREEIPILHPEFTTVDVNGGNINVYTVYYSYFPEFGTLGSVFMMALLGALVTWAFFKALSGHPRPVIFFALLFYGIPLSSYNENYFMNLNFLVKMFVLTCCCYGLPIRHRRCAAPC